ncbi:MAG: anhydro-N-acetylmuramic acid kinase [Deltaproteobacteria bacterium]|nr:anhydro-N-acetylmuramic acid kinase [Deltaproteobacteria bacterium]
MPAKTLIGLMSGTSHDGIDAALVDIALHRGRFRVRERAFCTFPYPRAVRARLLRLSQGATVNAGEVSQVNVLIGELFARAVLRLCQRAEIKPEHIDAVGSHGHTIYHWPRQKPGPGSTLQIGEPAVIAIRTGITTVADFRPADVAAGGEGAPLAPYVHHVLFCHPTRSVAVQNIGGIANLTYLPAGKGLDALLAFDSGPGNMVIDGVTQAVSGGKQLYDRNGRLARAGTIHTGFLDELLHHPYFVRRPPKSTGREEFGELFLQEFLRRAAQLHVSPTDQVATVTALTVESMARAYRNFVLPRGSLDEVLLAGGGRLNPTLRETFAQALPTVRVRTLEDAGYDSKALEAVAFAVLAFATLYGMPANATGATGAAESVVIGKIVPGRNYRHTQLG